MKLPDMKRREGLPDVDLSDLHVPHALRDVSMPDFNLPELHRPEIKLPDLKRDIKREAKAHHLHLPDVNLRDLDMGDVRALAHLGRPAPRARIPWAWITVAGLAGLFAGWWLSTSPVSGPKMHELADRVRLRIAAWRDWGSGWDDATEERTDGFWSREHGWQDRVAGTQSSGGHGSGERDPATASIDDAHQVATTDAPTAPRRSRTRGESSG